MNMSGYYLKNAFFFSTVYTQYIHILTTFKIVGILHAMEICINLLISICWNDFGVTVFPQMHFISIVPKWIKIYLKNSSYSNYQWCWSTVQFNCFYTCAQINTQHPHPPQKIVNTTWHHYLEYLLQHDHFASIHPSMHLPPPVATLNQTDCTLAFSYMRNKYFIFTISIPWINKITRKRVIIFPS